MLRPLVRQRGMTVVEVIIAVAIVGILLALAAPSMNTWIQNLQLRNAAESILGGAKRARYEAVSRNTTVAFELQDANSTAWHVCLFDVVNQTCKAAAPDIASKGASEGSPNARVGVELVFTNFNVPLDAGDQVPSLVAFDPFGRVSPSSPANITRIDVRNPTLSASDERRMSIFIGTGGEVRMCDPQLSLATNPQGCQ
jgi:type IV fimbrial biogenesis protein FimT